MDKSDRMSTLLTSVRSALAQNPLVSGHSETEAWLFRDDVGAPHGIKGQNSGVTRSNLKVRLRLTTRMTRNMKEN